MRHFALFLCLTVASFLIGRSQNPFSVDIDTAYISSSNGPAAPILENSLLVYHVTFKNTGNSLFSGGLDLGISIFSPNLNVLDTLTDTVGISLPANATVVLTYSDSATAARYGGGGEAQLL
ncbi:MAG: hypothetical protein ACKVTZ_21455 [Bacteroidia bacterium]